MPHGVNPTRQKGSGKRERRIERREAQKRVREMLAEADAALSAEVPASRSWGVAVEKEVKDAGVCELCGVVGWHNSICPNSTVDLS